jgi:hypothetical protein
MAFNENKIPDLLAAAVKNAVAAAFPTAECTTVFFPSYPLETARQNINIQVMTAGVVSQKISRAGFADTFSVSVYYSQLNTNNLENVMLIKNTVSADFSITDGGETQKYNCMAIEIGSVAIEQAVRDIGLHVFGVTATYRRVL